MKRLYDLFAKLLCLVFTMMFPVMADAQYIALKSVPVASGDQFLIGPSENRGMGGVAIALDDPVHDPFVNPAKGANLYAVHIFSAPTFYVISNNNGSARTLPLGFLAASAKWFAGVSLAIQQLAAPDDSDVIFMPDVIDDTPFTSLILLRDVWGNIIRDQYLDRRGVVLVRFGCDGWCGVVIRQQPGYRTVWTRHRFPNRYCQ
jgi:hypothetical protein